VCLCVRVCLCVFTHTHTHTPARGARTHTLSYTHINTHTGLEEPCGGIRQGRAAADTERGCREGTGVCICRYVCMYVCMYMYVYIY
jgi:hypothetical protein